MPERYGVVYADPPWSFKTYSRKGKGRSAESHYDCLSIDDIKEYLPNLAAIHAYEGLKLLADDCVLFMWVTDPFLPVGLDVIKAWGFTYTTVGFYWAKTIAPARISPGMACRALCEDAQAPEPGEPSAWPMGMGYWTRANPEMCLLATRGKPRRKDAGVRKLICAPRRSHSQKPSEIYQRIETLCTGPYVEFFARSRQTGWDSFGNEVDTGIAPRRWRSDGADIDALTEPSEIPF
jgi:N6-adenosine-specific RNA methylase IME4